MWDPDWSAVDRFTFGPGWTLGTYFIDHTTGFYLPGVGSFQFDQSWEPSHLHGYEGDDFVAQWFDMNAPLVLPARGDIPAQEAYKTLYQNSTGVTAYFSWNNNLIATIDKAGARKDWWFPNDDTENLTQIVEADGRVTYFLQVQTPWEWAIQTADGTVTYFAINDDGSGTIRTRDGWSTDIWPRSDFFGTITQSFKSQDSNDSTNEVNVLVTWDSSGLQPPNTVTRIARNNSIVYPIG